MATLHVDDELYRRIQASAEANGITPEAEAGRVLDAGVPRPRSPADRDAAEALIARLRAAHEEQRARHGVLPDSLPLIRAMREEA